MAFVIVSIGVIVLRRTRPDLPRPFRMPWVPVLPPLSALVSLIADARPATRHLGAAHHLDGRWDRASTSPTATGAVDCGLAIEIADWRSAYDELAFHPFATLVRGQVAIEAVCPRLIGAEFEYHRLADGGALRDPVRSIVKLWGMSLAVKVIFTRSSFWTSMRTGLKAN